MVSLVPVISSEDVEWLRQERNKPEQYKWFRQDKPITPEQQKLWWLRLDKTKVALFTIQDENQNRIGYVGFNPLNRYARAAEFGIFLVKQVQGKGVGAEALRELLRMGFEEMGLAVIYSDCLEYPGESRWPFYEAMGFVQREPECQHFRYQKQGKWISSIRFYMTKEMWANNVEQGVPVGAVVAAPKVRAARPSRKSAGARHRRDPSKADKHEVA